MRTGHTAVSTAVVLVACFAAPASAQDAGGRDYTQWRGPNRDGAVASFTRPRSWPEKLTLKWKVDVGAGYATPIVAGNRVYSFSRRDGDEVMMALDADAGKTVWQTGYPAPYKMNPATKSHGQGPKSTPLLYEGKLYTLGIGGVVTCFNAASGEVVWQKPAPPVDPLYGTAMSPVADRGRVIFHVGGHNQGALTAFDAKTGDVAWSWSGDGPAYGSPIIVERDGTRQVVTLTQQNIVVLDADSGQLLFQHPWGNRFSNNSITPVVYRDMIIVSGYELGTLALRLVRRNEKWEADTLWHTQDVSMYMSNPVVVGDTLYGLSQKAKGQFFALDVKTGKVSWRGQPREADNTAIAKAGDLLFLLNDDAELLVAASNPAGIEPLRRYTVADSATWAQPAISGNRVFVKDVSALALWTFN